MDENKKPDVYYCRICERNRESKECPKCGHKCEPVYIPFERDFSKDPSYLDHILKNRKNMSDMLNNIIEYYLSSDDFNGLPGYDFKGDKEELKKLIRDGKVEAIWNLFNSHIKFFNEAEPIEKQLEYVGRKDTCYYPTPEALANQPKDQRKIYTAMLQGGMGQFEIRYFDVKALEDYFNNPKYIIFDGGYRGSISIRDEYYTGEEDDEDLLKDYGMAYPVIGDLDRAVAVFIRDLAALSERSQMRWASYEKKNQSDWIVNGGFIKNTIYGEWVDKVWIFDAILQEQVIINKMCDLIGIKHIFSNTWNIDNQERPEGFRTILFPTRKNYYDFISVIEKMTANNISTKAFTSEQKHSTAILKEDDEGSIAVLEKWLNENGFKPDVVKNKIVAPLKKVRKIRQTPAHEFYSDEYDKVVYKEQSDILEDVYWSIHCLRLMLGSHPLVKSQIEIPDYLEDESNIVFY